MITKIRKRDGREVPFNIEKIANAILKAINATGEKNYDDSLSLAEKVIEHIEKTQEGKIPTVEEIQDAVEKVLIETGYASTAKAFILY
ncbi:MAG: anaerobic ribonucleoside triphosphate reductase, partial [Clostridiales bacterium]|nr:anaerobic ribonucleoside triphosphate reductase [Clostridiales bacterium]